MLYFNREQGKAFLCQQWAFSKRQENNLFLFTTLNEALFIGSKNA